MSNILVAPSMLSADFKKLEQEIKIIEEAGADWLHFDAMDGHFVPNISFGIPVLKSIAKCHNMINDVHLMISEPLRYAEEFIKAGADYLTFHYEACKDINEVLEAVNYIHEKGCKAGVSVKPKTPVDVLFPILDKLDLVLIMSVEPGFGGQSFMRSSLDQIKKLKEYLINNQINNCLIEVDGGINGETGKECVAMGVDVLVAGSYLFGKEDVATRIQGLKK